MNNQLVVDSKGWCGTFENIKRFYIWQDKESPRATLEIEYMDGNKENHDLIEPYDVEFEIKG